MLQGSGWKVVEYLGERWFVIAVRYVEEVREWLLQAVDGPFRVHPFIRSSEVKMVGWERDFE